jgi:hypothetical protein
MWTWWNNTSTEWQQRTNLTHIRGCRRDSNQYKITLQGINLTTRYTWATKATWMAIFGDDYQRVEPDPLYPSAVFHVKTSTGSPWVPQTLSQCHPRSTVGYHPTQRLSKLLSLRDPINLVCTSTSILFTRARRSVLNRHKRVLPPSELRIWKHTTLNLPVRYSPLSPSCPVRSHIKLHIRSLT